MWRGVGNAGETLSPGDNPLFLIGPQNTTIMRLMLGNRSDSPYDLDLAGQTQWSTLEEEGLHTMVSRDLP